MFGIIEHSAVVSIRCCTHLVLHVGVFFYTKFQTPNTVGNCHFTVSSKRLRYDEDGNRTVGRKFTIKLSKVRLWRHDHSTIFSCEATTKSFTGPKDGRHLDVNAAVLPFVKQTHVKLLPTTELSCSSAGNRK